MVLLVHEGQSRWLFVALILSSSFFIKSCSFMFRSSDSYSRIAGGVGNLWCSQAKETSETIEPTNFRNDLYEILGVNADASTAEIKKKYLKIVAMNHPDRNSTPEALMIFRNATRAYSTLKDPKLKRNYDTKLKTKEAIDTLETVGTEMIEVTGPLVGNAARAVYEEIVSPLSASAFEVTSAALEASRAASASSQSDSSRPLNSKLVDFEGMRDRWKAAETTFSSVRLQKRKEVTTKQLAKTIDAVEKAKKTIANNKEVLKKLNASIVSVTADEKQKRLEVEASSTIYEREARRLTESKVRLNASQTYLDDNQRSLSAIEASLNSTFLEKEAYGERISELEAQLKQLRDTRAALESSERSLQGEARKQRGVTDTLSKKVYSQKKEVDSLEKVVAAARSVFDEKNTALTMSRDTRESQQRSQSEQQAVEHVQRSILTQQLKKKHTLETMLKAVESEERKRDTK
jgi:curved DNA-binding protein CbpA